MNSTWTPYQELTKIQQSVDDTGGPVCVCGHTQSMHWGYQNKEQVDGTGCLYQVSETVPQYCECKAFCPRWPVR